MGSHKNNFEAQGPNPHRRKIDPLQTASRAVRQIDPSGGRLFISAKRRMAIARQRRETIKRHTRLKKYHSSAKSAQIVGASLVSIWRWKKAFAARGLAGLLPKTARCGRKSPFLNLRLTKETLQVLEMCHVEHPFSPRAAWQRFANSPSCPPLVARAVQRKGSAPAPLAGLGRVHLVQARVFASADERRLFVKFPVRGVLTAQIAVPPKFKLARIKK
jgi:hypothetical protein